VGVSVILEIAGGTTAGGTSGGEKKMRKLLYTSAAIVIATAATVAAALPAVASAEDDSPGPPSCLVTRTWDNWAYAYVEVTNQCTDTHRIQVDWTLAIDSQCTTLAPGQKMQDSALEPAWFVGLYDC
jgi:hypothetical protein